ncbi:MAG TPA: DUF2298 domain-containing protein [Burkholderiaceae bacterium]
MQNIYHLLTILLLWLHFAALSAFAGRWIKAWAIGRASAVMLLVLSCFFIEHIVGLGSLAWVMPLTTGLSLFVLWREHAFSAAAKTNGFMLAELVFGAALFYGVMWKEFFPNIYITSERLPDLVFITNFMAGEHLPAVDHWNPPYLFDYYYSLQYYAAALAGRVLHMSPGLTYNLCFAVIQALSVSLIWEIAARFMPRIAPRLLLVAVLVCGGTGASIFTHAIHDDLPNAASLGRDYLWQVHNRYIMGSGHFVGEFDKVINNKLGMALFPPPDPVAPVQIVGMENFGFQFYQSDYHAPLGGYCLLLLAIALICALEAGAAALPLPAGAKNPAKRDASAWQQIALGMTLPAVFAVNTWVVPLHAAMLGAWALWRAWKGRANTALRPDWLMLMGGGLFGFICLYFFLVGFTQARVPTPMRLVFPGQHTPLREFIALFWPLLVLLVLGLMRRETRSLTLFFSLLFAALLLFSECVFVDDPWDGILERYNTTMKWWGWIWTGGLTVLGALLLSSQRRWIRIATGFALSLTLVYAIDMVNAVRYLGEQSFGLLDGDYVYTREPEVREMFRYLAGAPDGVLLENQYDGGYHDGGAYGAFSAKPVLLGWPAHLDRWRGHSDARDILRRQINDFYTGGLPNILPWLAERKVRYIVWNARDTLAAPVWDRLNVELSAQYAWEAFGNAGGRPIGLWVKIEK